MSLHADSNVFALSEFNVTGSPLQLANRLKANKNASVLNPWVSSKCTARVEAHVNNKIYTFNVSLLLDNSS